MMQIVKKWQINVDKITFYIHDNHFTNVLRKLAEIEWENDPKSINISSIDLPKQEYNSLTQVVADARKDYHHK